MSIRPADIPLAQLNNLNTQMQGELRSILAYWLKYTRDGQDGFYGSVNWNDIPDPSAARGIVMYSRICWAFSAAYHVLAKEEYLHAASRAYRYIQQYFVDSRAGGVFWSVTGSGQMLDGKKQIYGQAFCIYALSEYYSITNDDSALQLAIDLFRIIELHSFDRENNGYLEALDRGWHEAADLRLSEKDQNERRSANTHLHIVEAYSNLYRIWPDDQLKERVQNLLHLFKNYIINRESGHLQLFFNDQWQPRSSLVSFGHDIEAAWLLSDCADAIGDASLIKTYQLMNRLITDAAIKGLDKKDGGLWYEYDAAADHWVREKHWWPQAEAMIGFFHAWQISNEELYLQYALKAWDFVRSYLHDSRNGEWFWGISEDYTVIPKEKAGFWKCPYHNSRACLELIRRIAYVLKKGNNDDK